MIDFPKFKHGEVLFWLLVALLVTLLLSCSPVKRLERLQEKHPYLFTAKKDTIAVKDTLRIVIPEVRADTVVSYESLLDTLYLSKDHFHVKIVRIPGDSIFLDGRCDTVYKTVYREIKVPYNKYEITPRSRVGTTFLKIALFLFLGFLLYIAYRFFRAE